MAATPEAPRLAPVPVKEWPAGMREAMAAMVPPNPRHPFPAPDPTRPKGLNALGTFALHPELARAYHVFAGHVLFATTLSVRQRELLVLRVAHVRQSGYEWLQHAVLAGEAGITPDEVGRVAAGPDAPGWSPFEASLLRAVDELVADARVAEDTWAVLVAELDAQQLLDLVFTVGAYDLLAMVFRTVGVEVDADLRDR